MFTTTTSLLFFLLLLLTIETTAEPLYFKWSFHCYLPTDCDRFFCFGCLGAPSSSHPLAIWCYRKKIKGLLFTLNSPSFTVVVVLKYFPAFFKSWVWRSCHSYCRHNHLKKEKKIAFKTSATLVIFYIYMHYENANLEKLKRFSVNFHCGGF